MSRRSWLDEMGMRKRVVRVEEEEEEDEEGRVSTAGCPLRFAPHSELPDLAGLGGHRPMGGLGTRMCPRLISGPLNVVFGRVGVSESEIENENEKESGLIHVGKPLNLAARVRDPRFLHKKCFPDLYGVMRMAYIQFTWDKNA